jgi:hypothetical protein
LSQSHRTDTLEKEQPVAHVDDGADRTLAAWEMLETGRYMPRRIRGSFPGRELG